jgi:2-polyprenyl-3-methyl-5-hydroxy-6-metoxy-1,4-benzoquinol methylase
MVDAAKEYFLLSETSSQFLEDGYLKEEYSMHLSECPVCEGIRFKKLFVIDGFNYYRCKDCSFVFVNPRLNDIGSQIWYNSPYYNAALNWEIFLNQTKETYFSVSLFPKHFRKVAELIGENFTNKKFEVIDLGCSTGSLLSYLKHEMHYSNLTGIDLNQKAVEFAKNSRNLNVYCDDATKFAAEDKKFDLVISTENIEHVNDLGKYIMTISNILNKNGQIIISTPHNDARTVRIMGKFGDHFCAPNHINYFNAETITRFLLKYGFQVKTIWLDEIKAISIYGLIKSKLFLPDQVVSEPPFEAYFSKPLYGNILKRKETVHLKLKANEDILNTSEIQNSYQKKDNFIKKILKMPLNIKTNNHMIVIARKKNEKE